MPKPFFVTTAIDYTNGAPHIGHAYEKVLADVIARYHRLKGEDVFFLTGVDQHGQKVQQSAEKQGVPPQQFVDEITAKFKALWKKLDVDYSAWAETTDELHKKNVRDNLQRDLWNDIWNDKDPATGESRWLYKKTERGWYSVRQEQFLTDKERGPDGEFGPEWQPVEERKEENFYFRLKEHKQWLLDFIEKRSKDGNPFVVPDFRVSELRNAVEKLEGDLCISRPESRLKWGIPFPETFGAGFVTYVWFDALVNYLTYAPYHDSKYGVRTAKRQSSEESAADASRRSFAPSQFNEFWPPLHVIGKDILIPAHGVYWPIMLKALGYGDDEMPTLLVHGWWNIAGAKMSKSLGNIVDPDTLADKYGAEAVRYYLMADIVTGKDADFSEDLLVQRYNVDLANSLGNLVNRSLSMAGKYRAGKLTKPASVLKRPPIVSELDFEKTLAVYTAPFEQTPISPDIDPSELGVHRSQLTPSYSVNAALDAAFRDVLICNQTIEITKPWALAKDATKAEDLDAVLYTLAESLRIIAILISPVLPKAANGIFDQLQWKLEEQGKESRFKLSEATWGKLPDGHVLGKPTPLFPRIEVTAP